MQRQIVKFLSIFLTFVLTGVLLKLLFLLAHGSMASAPLGMAGVAGVLAHGLPIDLAVAGYLSAVPSLLLIGEALSTRRKAFRHAERIYILVASALLALIAVLDLGLYPSWGFRLDMSPLFYFTTSPSAAMASVTTGQAALAVLGFLALWLALYSLFAVGALRIHLGAPTKATGRRKAAVAALGLGLTAALFIPIRGGLTVSTMNLSRAYFSTDRFLNHAAINPAFSLLYSATHQHGNDSRFDYMPDAQADAAFAALRPAATGAPSFADSILNTPTPDIYIVILESFSAELLPSLGGQPVATRLDSVARAGISFANFYSTSFRTDRGIPAILSAYPGAPTVSVMKYVEKTENLPSIASALADAGWHNTYYYGGDINFTNMLAYLVNTGFHRTVCDKDFDLADRTGKWGAHDHLVFDRCLADADTTGPDAAPQLRVIQTSSSHEPFEVPARLLPDKRANAFAYTDSCLADFLRRLERTPRADRSLVLIVPDHYGAYPAELADPLRRHHVPFVMTGHALAVRDTTITAIGSQTDIAPTLMSMLGLPAAGFDYGVNLFDPRTPKCAFFSEPSFMGLVAEGGHAVVDLETGRTEADTALAHSAKAYLQRIYRDFSRF